jgi:hypothetical protein
MSTAPFFLLNCNIDVRDSACMGVTTGLVSTVKQGLYVSYRAEPRERSDLTVRLEIRAKNSA